MNTPDKLQLLADDFNYVYHAYQKKVEENNKLKDLVLQLTKEKRIVLENFQPAG
ncbi:hypothetical protein ABFV99_13460 [Cytobacillus horneckiae]|uniref:hypothetical protein n=1 Tax=Cytobacillus horneckiae TaxID=549687 RepID=UPI0034CD4D5E